MPCPAQHIEQLEPCPLECAEAVGSIHTGTSVSSTCKSIGRNEQTEIDTAVGSRYPIPTLRFSSLLKGPIAPMALRRAPHRSPSRIAGISVLGMEGGCAERVPRFRLDAKYH